MTTEVRMSVQARTEYLQVLQPRYRAAKTRAERSALLDRMCLATQLHRDYLVTKLRAPTRRRARRQRSRSYGHEVDASLAVIWEALDYVCAERLQPNVLRSGQLLAQHGELH